MQRRERTKILVEMDIDSLRELDKLYLSDLEFKLVKEPSSALVLTKFRESVKSSLYYMGEVLITEAKYKLGEKIGIGIIRGIEDEKSTILAKIDALFNSQNPVYFEIKEKISIKLREKKHELYEEKKKEIEKILRTRVEFETIYEEVKS